MSNDASVLEHAMIRPARLPKRRIQRFAYIAASLGALGVAALGCAAMRGPQASAHVGAHISSPESPSGGPAVNVSRVTTGAGRIQVALLLQTSSSMSGLIDQARSELWKIVTRLAAARRDGRRPTIEIALYEYGNNARGTSGGSWVLQLVPFTSDLDLISEKFFALDTQGDEEYAGTAIAWALADLQWSKRPSDLKLLFVAGNEAFDQGPLDPVKSAPTAKEKGIQVTAILCGHGDPTWSLGAKQARFGYFKIDASKVLSHIDAPQDAEIARLRTALEKTYFSYGIDGERGHQIAWDLGDEVHNAVVNTDKLSDAQLPDEMRGMNGEQRRAHVAKKFEEREQLEKRIQELVSERAKFIASARQTESAADTVDSAMLRSVAAQARAVGFQLDGK